MILIFVLQGWQSFRVCRQTCSKTWLSEMTSEVLSFCHSVSEIILESLRWSCAPEQPSILYRGLTSAIHTPLPKSLLRIVGNTAESDDETRKLPLLKEQLTRSTGARILANDFFYINVYYH